MTKNKLADTLLNFSQKLEKSSCDFDDILQAITTETTKILNAERTTLYIYDEVENELWSKIAQDLEISEIRLKLGVGIAGSVAMDRQLLNIKDAYNDSRFDPKWDELTNYKTKTLIAAPLLNTNNKLIGIIEVINKKETNFFNEQDENILLILSKLSAIAIEQAQLKEANNILRKYNHSIISNISSALVVTDLECNIIFCNDAFLKLFHLEKIPSDVVSLLRILENVKELPDFFNTLKSIGIHRIDEVELDIGGKRHFISLKGSSLKYADKFILGYIIVIDDKTEYVQLHKEKERTEKLTLIGNMTNNILHDIKNPLTVIKGYLYILAKKCEGTEINNFCELINCELNKINNMAKEILEFTRGEETLYRNSYNVIDFFNEVKHVVLEELKGKSIDVDFDIQYDGNAIFDSDKMWRIILNIACNAKEAIDIKGKFRIKVYSKEKDLYMVLSDDGCGMPEYVVNQIFKPFFTHGKKSGIGLGMAIVKRIVELHHGKIAVDSKPGKGTVVIISFPVNYLEG